MKFLQWEQVVGLKQPLKTQTRRLAKLGEVLRKTLLRGAAIFTDTVCYEQTNRGKWQVGLAYAVQVSRGTKAIGRFGPIRKIRKERLGDISDSDCLAEGIVRQVVALLYGETLTYYDCPICARAHGVPQDAYACLWKHCGGDWDRDQDKDVWVLDWSQA